MNKITRAEVNALVLPGDVIAVRWLKRDLTAVVISDAEGDAKAATHALCGLGGLDIVEAGVLGVVETSLHNYLRGNCELTVRSADPGPTPEQAEKATDFWSARVNDPYDKGMIVGSIPIFLAKHVLGFFSQSAGDWAMRRMPNLLASSNLSTCAELGARGLREFTLIALKSYDVKNVTPEILRTDDTLRTKAVLTAAVLVD